MDREHFALSSAYDDYQNPNQLRKVVPEAAAAPYKKRALCGEAPSASSNDGPLFGNSSTGVQVFADAWADEVMLPSSPAPVMTTPPKPSRFYHAAGNSSPPALTMSSSPTGMHHDMSSSPPRCEGDTFGMAMPAATSNREPRVPKLRHLNLDKLRRPPGPVFAKSTGPAQGGSSPLSSHSSYFNKLSSSPPPQPLGGTCLPPPTPTFLTSEPSAAPRAYWAFNPESSNSLTSAKELASHALPRALVDGYTPTAELGEGGFGFVVAAHSHSQNCEVAIKFIYRHKVPKRGWVSSETGPVPTEIYILRKLRDEPDHYHRLAHVITMIEDFADERFFILVMHVHGRPWHNHKPVAAGRPVLRDITNEQNEQVLRRTAAGRPPPLERRPSHDLFECIEQASKAKPLTLRANGQAMRTGGFDEATTRHISRQVVETIAALDERGIVHRDIKDENVLIDENMNVKLIDFGSAAILEPQVRGEAARPVQKFDRFYGTLPFASPQILRGKSYQAEPAEVWSLAILMCVILIGDTPFANNQDAIAGDWRTRVYARLARRGDQLSPLLESLLSGMLQTEVESRLDIYQVLAHPWWRVDL